MSPDKGKDEVSITRKAFDTFPLKMTVHFTKDCGVKPFDYCHNLSFDRFTTKSSFKVQFAYQKLEPLVLTPYELKKAQRDRDKI